MGIYTIGINRNKAVFHVTEMNLSSKTRRLYLRLRNIFFPIIAGLLAFFASSNDLCAQEGAPVAQLQRIGGEIAKSFYNDNIGSVWKSTTPDLRVTLKSEDNLRTISEKLVQKLGSESSIVHEDTVRSANGTANGLFQYTRVSGFKNTASLIELKLGLTWDGHLETISVGEAPPGAPAKFVGYIDRTALHFPLKGEMWTVDQGGPLPSEDAHYASPGQSFAYDLILVKDYQFYWGNASKNENWFAFGQRVVAPADGKIVVAQDSSEDNVPLNSPASISSPQGNTIVIDHGNGEYSMFAHLRHGSFKVHVGDIVRTGQTIAEVGNSGESKYPHLTYNLGTKPAWGQGDGLPIQFVKILVKRIDGNGIFPVSTHVPVRGDLVQ